MGDLIICPPKGKGPQNYAIALHMWSGLPRCSKDVKVHYASVLSLPSLRHPGVTSSTC